MYPSCRAPNGRRRDPPQAAVRRFQDLGYDANLWIAEDGRITSSRGSWTTDNVVINDVARFEGASNPDDESILLAVEIAEDGILGLLSLPYGPNLSGAQAETINDLDLRRRDGA